MFEPASRYYAIESVSRKAADGRELTYKRRRFLPQGERLPTMVEVIVSDGDRLDLIAARTVGDSEQFWRICDAENAIAPADLTAESGRVLRVPLPQPGA